MQSIDKEISAAEHFAILKSEPLRTYSGTLHWLCLDFRCLKRGKKNTVARFGFIWQIVFNR
jgi:hypothetical protein